MANSPSIENVQRGLRVRRELDAKIVLKFKNDKAMTITDCYLLALMYATKDVELPASELVRIAKDKIAASKRLKKEGVR